MSRARKKIISDYFLHGQKLEAVTETKYLGVTISDDGEWDTHITNTINSGNRLLGFLRRNLKVNSKAVKELAYKMLVRPKLEYAASVWDPHQENQTEGIERIQKRAARFVENRHRNTSSVSSMLFDLQWVSLKQRRQNIRLCLLYKIRKNAIKVTCLGLKPAVSRARRQDVSHDQQLNYFQCSKEYRFQAFFPRTVREWNKLPQRAVSATDITAFRSVLASL